MSAELAYVKRLEDAGCAARGARQLHPHAPQLESLRSAVNPAAFFLGALQKIPQ